MYKMKLLTISVALFTFLSGCSILDDVNNSLDYGNEAMEYVEKVQTFSEEIPVMAEEAIHDSQVKETLEQELQTMLAEIEAFNELKAPEIADSVHEQITSANEQLSGAIDSFLADVEAGKWNPDFLQESAVLDTMNDITALKSKLEDLGL